MICFECGEVGHRSVNCMKASKGREEHQKQPDRKETEDKRKNATLDPERAEGEPRFGPWMIVQRKPRNNGASLRHNSSPNLSEKMKNKMGNRFAALENH